MLVQLSMLRRCPKLRRLNLFPTVQSHSFMTTRVGGGGSNLRDKQQYKTNTKAISVSSKAISPSPHPSIQQRSLCRSCCALHCSKALVQAGWVCTRAEGLSC